MEQLHRQAQPPRDDDNDAPGAVAPTVRAAKQDEALDALLDDIDQVLETNAEAFVRGFVQKGGQ
jgi:ubiquitin-like protein Pup